MYKKGKKLYFDEAQNLKPGILEKLKYADIETIAPKEKSKIKTVRECFEDALKRGYVDRGLYKYLDKEELEEIKINIDSEDLKREIEEYGKIDIDEIGIAFKNLEKALEGDDTPKHWLAFKRFQFWLALRQIPIKIADLYMYMGNMGFKNIRFRSYVFIDENRVDLDYKGYYDSIHKENIIEDAKEKVQNY
ncbi:MAG: hypothetical protein ACTSQJ_01800 [Promethearchaeota archaeon]